MKMDSGITSVTTVVLRLIAKQPENDMGSRYTD